MRSFAAGALRRRVGLDRNPLLRGSDRVEAAIAAVLMVAFIAGLGGAWHAGKQAYDAGVAAERAQATTRRLIVATVVQDAHKSPGSAEAPMVTQRVRAVWQAPDGTVRGGRVRVPTSTKAGTQTSVWIDQSGRIVPPPQSRSDTVARAALIAVGATTGIALLLRLTFAAVHWMLDRRRLARWAADWARIEPRWTRRR